MPEEDAIAFVHTATAANSTDHVIWLDHPRLNRALHSIAIATQNWNPGSGTGSIYNNSVIGLWCDTARSRWAIMNQGLADIPEGAAFTVLVFYENRFFLPFVEHNVD